MMWRAGARTSHPRKIGGATTVGLWREQQRAEGNARRSSSESCRRHEGELPRNDARHPRRGMAPALQASLRVGLIAAVVGTSAALPMTAAHAAGPTPQSAPVTTPAPSPDPAPSARHHPTTTSTHVSPAAPTHPATSAPVTHPTITTPAVTTVAPAATVRRAHAQRRVKATHHPRARAHPRHHAAPARHSSPVAHPVAPVVARHPAARAAPAHSSGVVLLVGALVLLALVAASLGLLRVANRLHREITGSAA